MKKIRSFTSILLVVTVLFTLLSTVCVSADAVTIQIDNIKYTLDTTKYTAELTEFISGDVNVDVVVPAVVTYEGKDYKVTSIKGSSVTSSSTAGDGAFRYSKVNSVTLPEGLVSIGKEAFYYSNVTSINIPSTVRLTYNTDTSIFKACQKLVDVKISEGLNCIPSAMFYLTGLESLVIPKSVKTMVNAAFARSYYLKEITILSDSFSIITSRGIAGTFTLTGSDAWGNDKDTNNPSKAIYSIQSESVKTELLRAGVAKDNIKMFDGYPVYFYYNNGTTADGFYEVDKTVGKITLPDASLDGYYFKGWYDGSKVYEAGADYSLTSGLIFIGGWEKDNEAETILYKDISTHNALNTFDNSVYVRRMYNPDFANSTLSVTFTDSNDVATTKDVVFDKNGSWINYTDETLYKQVTINGTVDCSNLYILTDCEDNYEVTLPIKKSRHIIFPRINWVFDQSQFDWKSSDPTVAKVTDGAVFGVKSGEVVVTAQYNGISYSVKINVIGEIANAIQNGTVDAYLSSKKPIIDEINAAITDKDKTRLSAVLKSTGTIKLSDILDIDTTVVEGITDVDFFDKFLDRIISYKEFDCSSTDDILYLSEVIINEINAGYLNGLDNTTAVEGVLNNYYQYFGIDLTNKYYLENKEEVLGSFVNYTAENVEKIKLDFIEAYVMTAYKNELGYDGLQKKIENMQTEIGYSETGFENKNNSALYIALLGEKENISTIKDLKDYIDNYVYAPGGGSGGGSSGGGGGGGSLKGGSMVGNKDMDVFIDENAIEDIEDTSIPQLVSLFGDVKTDRWSYSAIQLLVAKGAVSGYEDGNFQPTKNITRAEFVKILSNTYGLIVEEKPAEGEQAEEVAEEFVFADVSPDAWYFDAVKAAKVNGIVTGTDNYFKPNDLITREEMSTILYRLMILKGIESDKNNSVKFSDEGSINDWAYLSVMKLSKMGIINGYENGTFMPRYNATREEAVKVIADTLKLLEA